MTQYVEHYLCNGAPCVHVEPALPLADLDYLMGLSPARYPLPVTEWDNALAMPIERVGIATKRIVLDALEFERAG